MEKLFPVNVCIQFVFSQVTHGTLNAENYYYYENDARWGCNICSRPLIVSQCRQCNDIMMQHFCGTQ